MRLTAQQIYDKLNFPTSKVESIPDKKWDSRDKNTD